MTYFFNAILAIFIWLGLFRLDLFPTLMTRPFGETIAVLTFGDYLLLVVTFIVATGAMEVVDRVIGKKKQQRPVVLQGVKKR
jgi:hypothetical protein